MGLFAKLVDATLFGFFVVIGVGAPLLGAQTFLPASVFPDVLLELNQWYSREFGDYLVDEKPHFFVGLVWLELFFQWPLTLANLYGIVAAKPWLRTTCLIYGTSVLTSMVAILSEMIGSGKASEKLLRTYFPFLGLAVLAMLRGLVPQANKSVSTAGKVSALGRKKRA